MSNVEQPTVVDLFCGAGGLALGFIQAGFKIVVAKDANPAAVATYRANVGPHVEQEGIFEETGLPNASVFIGGPPCQGFSSAGMRRPGDARNTLVTVYARLIAPVQRRAAQRTVRCNRLLDGALPRRLRLRCMHDELEKLLLRCPFPDPFDCDVR